METFPVSARVFIFSAKSQVLIFSVTDCTDNILAKSTTYMQEQKINVSPYFYMAKSFNDQLSVKACSPQVHKSLTGSGTSVLLRSLCALLT